MERTILFRGKDIKINRWVRGGYYAQDNGACLTNHHRVHHYIGEYHFFDWDLVSTEWYEVNPNTIGQYTEVNDKNNTPIYEDDVVSAHYIIDGEPIIGAVTFRNGSFCIKHFGRDNAPNFDLVRDIKVLGNIHDNPELLKE